MGRFPEAMGYGLWAVGYGLLEIRSAPASARRYPHLKTVQLRTANSQARIAPFDP